MGMVGHQGPGIADRLGFGHKDCYAIDKLFFILIVFEYFTTLDSPDDNMMQCTRCVQAGESWYAVDLTAIRKVVYFFMDVPKTH